MHSNGHKRGTTCNDIKIYLYDSIKTEPTRNQFTLQKFKISVWIFWEVSKEKRWILRLNSKKIPMSKLEMIHDKEQNWWLKFFCDFGQFSKKRLSWVFRTILERKNWPNKHEKESRPPYVYFFLLGKNQQLPKLQSVKKNEIISLQMTLHKQSFECIKVAVIFHPSLGQFCLIFLAGPLWVGKWGFWGLFGSRHDDDAPVKMKVLLSRNNDMQGGMIKKLLKMRKQYKKGHDLFDAL